MERPPTGRTPRWMDDNDSDICLGCSKEFGVLLRRHHCRRCGGLFCADCSNEYVQIPVPLLISPPLFSVFVDVDPSVPNRCCSSCVLFIREFLDRRQQRSQQQRQAALAEAASVEQRIPSRIHRSPSPILPPPPVASTAVSSTSSSVPGVGVVSTSATVSSPTTGSGTNTTTNSTSTSTSLPSSDAPVAVVQGPAPLDDPHFESNTTLAASGLRIVPCQELLLLNHQRGQLLSSTPEDQPPPPPVRYKLYLVNVPYEIPPARKFQVNLDGRVLTVVLPYEVRPGDRCLIQAPAPPLVLKRATAAPIAPCTKREGYVSCVRCSFDNSVALLACQMCGETISLTHEALREQVLPETRVLEITEQCYEGAEWYHKRYLHKVPLHVRPDDVFEVILDYRPFTVILDYSPFTVICPVEAMGGDNIVIIAPATNNNNLTASDDGQLGVGSSSNNNNSNSSSDNSNSANNNSSSNNNNNNDNTTNSNDSITNTNSDSIVTSETSPSNSATGGDRVGGSDTTGGTGVAQSSSSSSSSSSSPPPSSDPISVIRPLPDTLADSAGSNSDPSPSNSIGPNPSPSAGPSASPSSSLVCRLCTFENTSDNLRSLASDGNSTRASDEPVSFCGMCGEPLLAVALVSSANNDDSENNPSSSSSSSASSAASSHLHPSTTTNTAASTNATNDDGVPYPVATAIPSALPALTVISSLRPLHNQNNNSNTNSITNNSHSNINSGHSNHSNNNNNSHRNNDDSVAMVNTTVYSNARMLISRSDDHPRSASSRNLSLGNNDLNSSSSNSTSNSRNNVISLDSNTNIHDNDNDDNDDEDEDGDRSPPCVLAEQWLLCIHCGADNPPPPPGESLTARCETCRRLLLYNEQEPGLAPGQGPGQGPGLGLGSGHGPGPHPEHESGPGLGHEPESELGSGSGSEVPDGGSEVGVVAVASLDLAEGAAATAIPTVAVLR